jgi:hypothetical protein
LGVREVVGLRLSIAARAVGPAALVLLALAPIHAAAASITVNTNADAAAVGGDCNGSNTCTLRDATTLANDAGGTNGISFASTVTSPIVLNQGPLTVTGETLTISGLGAGTTVIDGNDASTVFSIGNGATLNLTGATVQHGKATTTDGGGFFNAGTLTLLNVVVANNRAPQPTGCDVCTGVNGGGISSSGALTVTDSTITGNSATQFGGGIDGSGGSVSLDGTTVSQNTASPGSGAGIYTSFATLTVTRSLFSANAATAWGGGILAGGPATVINSTFYKNTSAVGLVGFGGYGGAIYFGGAGAFALINDTIVDNAANTLGGGLWVDAGSSSASISNTLLAGDSPQECGTNSTSTVTVSGGHNDAADSSCDLTLTSDRHDSSPGVDTQPRDNGGPTQTIALLPGSPAIDAGGDSVCNASIPNGAGGVDERGVARPQGAHCDIGALEVDGTTTAVTESQPIPGGDVTITATVTGTTPLAGTPLGTVTFSKNGATLGTPGLSGSPPSASLNLGLLAAMDPTISAAYTPTNSFYSSSGSVTFTPTAATALVPVPATGSRVSLTPLWLVGGGGALALAAARRRRASRRSH